MARPSGVALAVLLVTLGFPPVVPAAGDLPLEIRRSLLKRDYAEAIDRLAPMADQGDPQALYELARLYGQGLGVDRDDAGALDLLQRAAAAGHADAAYLAGSFYENARGVDADPEMAQRFFQNAAARGHELARRKLSSKAHDGRAMGAGGQAEWGNGPSQPVPEADEHGRLPLGMAAQAGDLERARALLAAGAAIGRADRLGNTALHYAAQTGEREIVELLLAAGADPVEVDSAGNTALHLAVAARAPQVVAALLQAGASRTQKNYAGWSAAMLAERSTDTWIRRVLLDDSPGPESGESASQLRGLDDSRIVPGWTKLGMAAWEGKLELVQALIRDREPVNELDEDRVSPLGRAVMGRRALVARYLIKQGADTSAPVGEGSLLHEAVRQRDADLVRLLMGQPAILDRPDAAGRTPLLLALELKVWPLADALLAGGASVGVRNGEGYGPLHLLARAGEVPLARTVLSAGARVNDGDGAGRTALWWATRLGHLEMVRLLLAAGAEAVAAQDGSVPVHQAAQLEQADILAQLTNAGHPLDVRTRTGSSPLLLAAQRGGAATVSYLIERDLAVNSVNNAGDSPLICAVREDRKTVARLLMKAGANPLIRNAQFISAGDLAADRDDPEWAEILGGRSGLLGLLGGIGDSD